MLRAHLDHIVIAAPSLEAGAEYVRAVLGVEPQAGGEHPRMGTHNRLLLLGGDAYLEVIAVNPGAPPPARPRWFQLDDSDLHQSPRLATWVVRTNDIHAAVAASPIPLGKVEAMTRGTLEWLITVPEDGRLLLDGMAPVLIQWPEGVHPTRTLEDRGCRLVELQGLHPAADTIDRLLAAIGFKSGASFAPGGASFAPSDRPFLRAQIETPSGPRTLGGL